MDINEIISRKFDIFQEELCSQNDRINEEIESSSFLVIGGAGTIGQAVVKELFSRSPSRLHVVDISENNLVELVRDIRSSFGHNSTEFDVFAIDAGSSEFDSYLRAQPAFDYVLNLSALKHVRSEKDPYTLLRMTNVNIINTIKLQEYCEEIGAKKYFCVSTDKAANPANLMGASKRIMEIFLMQNQATVPVSMARFANVAFSDGSLLHGFNYRIQKRQPISAPNDIKRYFITAQEAGRLCVLSCLLGGNNEIFFPNHHSEITLQKFSNIAESYLRNLGLIPVRYQSEAAARSAIENLDLNKEWPCYFFNSDTTGEKLYEEFYTETESLDLDRMINIGVIKNDRTFNNDMCNVFLEEYYRLCKQSNPKKDMFVELYKILLPYLEHEERNKNLNDRM